MLWQHVVNNQNGRHLADNIFKWIFLYENVLISVNISLKLVHSGLIINKSLLVQVMACHQTGNIIWTKDGLNYWRMYMSFAPTGLAHWGRDKMAAIFTDVIFKYISLNENFQIWNKISLKYLKHCWYVVLKHICVTWPHWVKEQQMWWCGLFVWGRSGWVKMIIIS